MPSALFLVIPSALFLVTPSAFSCHSEHLFLSFRAPFPVIPSESEESMTLFVLAKADVSLRLRSVQHNKSRSVTPNAARNP